MIVAAIDTGGTKIVGAAVDETGKILTEIRISNIGKTGSFILETYFSLLKQLQDKYAIEAIGIGTGGRIEKETGEILYAAGIYKDYIGLRIKERVERHCNLPTVVINDCRAPIIGEQWMGAAVGYTNILGVILGTGVGGGYMYENSLLDGTRGGLGELGHWILHKNGRECTCGQKGCVEQYISGTALWRGYNELYGTQILSSGYGFFQLVQQGDSIAETVLNTFTDDLASCLVSCANLFDPQVILVGGGVAETGNIWWEEVLQKYHAMGNAHTKNIALKRAQRGNHAALIGAAKVAIDYKKI